MKKLTYLTITLTMFISCTRQPNKFPELTGAYLGQKLPGDSAVLFAPGIVSTGCSERDIVFTPDGNEIFFRRSIGLIYSTIFHTKKENGKWLEPEVFEYCTDTRYKYLEPFITADGKKLFFVSNKPVSGEEPGSYDIWVSEKNNRNEWGEPYNIGEPVNTGGNDYFPTLTKDGVLYYTALDTSLKEEFIYRSKFVNGKYTKPEKLNEKVNGGKARYNAAIAYDESYIIVPMYGTSDSPNNTNYYILFRDENDHWSNPINLEKYLKSGGGWSITTSPDQKYLFFMSAKVSKNMVKVLSRDKINELHNNPQNGNPDIYWIKSDFIEDLREQAEF